MIRRVARCMALIVPAAIALMIMVLAVRHWLGLETHWIDYDAPGVDITSEGPEEWK